MKVYNTIHEAYLDTLAEVYDNPDYTAEPRGQRTREKLDYSFKVLFPLFEPIKTYDLERNKVIERYTNKECELYNAGSNLASEMAKASKFWLNIANPDGTINSNYGYNVFFKKSHGNEFETESMQVSMDHLSGGSTSILVPKMRTPWEWAKESLVRDKDTRQAVMRIALPEHHWVGNKDFTCTLHGIFLIRNNKLNLSVNMRSNDLTLGLIYDMPWFVSLIYRMIDELQEVYPELGVGTYTHYVHSLHIYDRDEEKILKMLGRK